MIWLYVGFGIVGATVGSMIGLSDSPVITTLVPLLFALIVGGGGIYAAGIDVSDSSGREKIARMGKMLVVFSGPLLIASMYGIVIRTGAGFRGFIPTWHDSLTVNLAKFDIENPSSALQIVALRYRLKVLGATDEEVSIVLNRIRNANKFDHDDINQKLANSSRLVQEAQERAKPDHKEILGKLLGQLKAIGEIERKTGEGSSIYDAVKASALDLGSQIHGAYREPLEELPDLRNALWSLETAMLLALVKSAGGNLEIDEGLSDQINKLLSATNGRQPPEERQIKNRI